MTETVDAIVIGTGQAGKPLTTALAEAGRGTVIIERARVGGTCIIEGCTPTKTMVASARVAAVVRRSGEYGICAGEPRIDMQRVRERKRTIVDSFSGGSEQRLLRAEGVELVRGDAAFTGPREVRVTFADGGTRTFTAPLVFINAGARPFVPPLPGLRDGPFLDSTSIMELAEVPPHLIVLGGGFIGLEFAQMFRRFGAEVTVVERGPRIAPNEDDDVADALGRILEEDGVRLRTGATASAVEWLADGVVLRVADEAIHGSHLLVAVGRTPNTDTLGCAAAGIDLDARGYIRVNDRLETSAEGVYALGDVNGGPPFTHIAYDDYRIVRDNLLRGGRRTTRGRHVPYTVFTDPQLGRVGLTERAARELGLNVKVARMPMAHVARALESDEARGLMKAVVEAGTGRILGAAVLGMEGGELATMLQLAIEGGLTADRLSDAVFPHPGLGESLNNLFARLC